jgi:hypothetical protein
MASLKIEDLAYLDLSHLDKGRLDRTLSSEITVVASVGTKASVIARRWDSRPGGIVLVTRADAPIGVLEPRSFLRQMSRYGVDASRGLREAVLELELHLNPEGAHRVGRRFAPRFLYARPPDDTWCSSDGGHYGDGDPCSWHRI